MWLQDRVQSGLFVSCVMILRGFRKGGSVLLSWSFSLTRLILVSWDWRIYEACCRLNRKLTLVLCCERPEFHNRKNRGQYYSSLCFHLLWVVCFSKEGCDGGGTQRKLKMHTLISLETPKWNNNSGGGGVDGNVLFAACHGARRGVRI